MEYFKKYEEFISEGLNKTYSPKKVIKHLVNNTPLREDDVWVSTAQNDTLKMNVSITRRTMNEAKTIVDTLTNVYGWYLSGVTYDVYDDEYFAEEIKNPPYEYLHEILVDEDGHEDSILFIFEAKYDVKYEGTDTTLYHVTDKTLLDKIMKIGLVPKTKNKIAVHPDRVYLMLTYESIIELLKNVSIDIQDEVVLEVDIKGLDIELYLDPNMPDAVYTYSNIPPQNLKALQPS